MDSEMEDSSTQMKCPCCGEMISLTCAKGGGEQEPDADDGQSWSDEDFRQAMSPRNDDTPQTPA